MPELEDELLEDELLDDDELLLRPEELELLDELLLEDELPVPSGPLQAARANKQVKTMQRGRNLSAGMAGSKLAGIKELKIMCGRRGFWNLKRLVLRAKHNQVKTG